MRPRLVRATPMHALGAAILATVLAVVLGLSPAAVRPVLAAGPLRIEADATYVLDPRDGRVHVSIDFELTNLKPDTASTIFYYDSLVFAVQPEAAALQASDASGALSVSTRERRFFTRVDVNLRSLLYYGQTTRFTVRYDLVGGAPRSDSWVRVSRAFATFAVWAWGDAGRSTVEVRIPDAYETQVDGDRLELDRDGPGQKLTAEPDKPRTFYAIVNAEDLAAYGTDRVSVEGGIELVVRSWPEDDRWAKTVSDTLRVGMPELVELIGLDWPVEHDLEVRERFTPALEGYAGVFLTDEQRIEISEDLDPVTIMHEASHAWFNDALFVERWIYEGLAEEYSWRAQRSVGGEAGFGATRPETQDPGRVPLESWRYPSIIPDEETDDRERYGYQASFWVVHNVVEAAGVEHMREAFASAEGNLTAYVGAPAPETVPELDDWRRFLDLAQPIDQPEPAAINQALINLVLEPRDAHLISERQAARDEYRALLAAGDGWLPPWVVRSEMGDWAFADAEAAMAQATAVLELRDDVDEAAAAAGLAPDEALRTAYETATASFDDASAVARKQLDALAAIAGAKAVVDTPVDLVAQIGLLGAAAPADSHDAARAAFERGELDAAIATAGSVTTSLAGAAAAGQQRVLLGAVVLVGLVVLLAVFLALRRRRRRRAALALATAPAGPVSMPLSTVSGFAWPSTDALRPAVEGAPAPGTSASPVVAPHAPRVTPLNGPANAPLDPPLDSPLDPPLDSPLDPPRASPEWPLADLPAGAASAQPEPAWWLPTRSSPDPAAPDTGTLAADPVAPSPPPAANPPDPEGDASPGESPDR